MRVRYSTRSREDLKAILGYLNERSPRGSRNVKRAIRQGILLISSYPGLGSLSGEGDTRVIPIRGYPYLIYWTVANGFVTILHIRHAARVRPEEIGK